ncbi:MAG: choice-of-anchor L domain-containing protein [Sphingobacteriales bacterium JAD_PAG50586_3]|nr:MAG: choice-of-anchor L domain-containing protein [Sphingobacteriales bacterium JAD_PAG50586_3]
MAPSSPTDIVQNVLVGSGVTVNNVTFNGAPIAYGTFNGTNSNIGLPNGVIITTGSRGVAPGPNSIASAGVDNGVVGDATLTAISGFETYDASVLEFDFIPQSGQISFNYVFASEEYPEFVGQIYNDVFAFFISGPNPGGSNYNNANIAIIPGTSTPVAINNVNQISYTNYYVDNTGGQTVQYDGFTKPMTAQANVVPCETYHIKICIADAGDGIYDSAVFLEALSFSSATNDVIATVTYGNNNSLLYEGCGQANIKFTKSVATQVAETFDVTITGTAINGVDYSQFPTQVTFQPGDTVVIVPLVPIFDGVTEPNETVTITITQDICGTIVTKEVNLTITNVEPLVVTVSPDYTSYICPNIPTPLTATATGGISPYTYTWDNGLVGQTVTVFPQQTTTYTVTVTDACNSQTAQAQALIDMPGYVPLELITPPDTTICPGDSILLFVSSRGGEGDTEIVFSWDNNLGNGSSKWVKPSGLTVYTVTVTDSCGTTVTKEIVVDVLPTNANFSYFYLENRKVKFLDESSTDVINWYWDFGDFNTSTEQNPLHNYADTGLYRVTLIVENQYGCTDTIIKNVRAYPDYTLYVPNAFTPNGDDINENFSGLGQGFINYEMYIFNRWGEPIFKSTDYANRWDGRDKSGHRYLRKAFTFT